jgi:hypothetical protein
MECDFATALPYKFRLQNNAGIIEDLQEENSKMLANYSRRLQDYSRISWSTFQPGDASSILEDFWLVVLGGLSSGLPWAHYLGGYQDRLLGGPLGLLGLCYTAPDGVRHKDYIGEVLG